MRHKDHKHCPICDAKFETQVELEQHNRFRHTQQGVSGVIPTNEFVPEPEQSSERKNRTFTRGHME